MTANTLQSAIAGINTAWDAAFNRGDAAIGAVQIESLFAGAIAQGIHNHHIELHAVAGDAGMATQRGRWSAQARDAEGGLQTFSGHITVVYRRQPDGSWRALTHTWN